MSDEVYQLILAGTLPGAIAQGEGPVANLRFEMFEVRQVLTRMRLGDTDRAIARAGLMDRRKLAQLRRTAVAAGWLDEGRGAISSMPRPGRAPGRGGGRHTV